MKTNTEIICTIVPRGIDKSNQFHFSLFLTPRLYQSGTLRLYDEIKQWHQYRDFFTNNKRLQVKFGTLDNEGEQMTIKPQNLRKNVSYMESQYRGIINKLADSSKGIDLWPQLFGATTPVKAWSEHQEFTSGSLSPLYASGTANSATRSFSATSAAENLKSLAKNLAHSESFEDLRKKSLAPDELNSNKENQEFHSKMSILSDYPHLLRLLGWIYDFSFPLVDDEEIKNTFSQCNLIKFIIDGHEPPHANDAESNLWNSFAKYVTFISPWSYFDPVTFTMKYKNALSEGNSYYLIEDGFLKSKSDKYEIKATQLDLKRIIQKYLETEIKDGTTELPLTDSLSSTGIALVVQTPTNQKLPLESAIDSKPAPATVSEITALDDDFHNNEPINNYVLFGHHLDTGYRIDVVLIEKVIEVEEVLPTGEVSRSYAYTYQTKNDKINFHSLCQRLSNYFIDRENPAEHLALFKNFEDEPWVAESAQLGASGKLYYDVELCRWNNWSLTCPHLGNYPQDEEETGDKFHNDIELENIKPVPGSLLPLRFGKRYAFRIRIVDICGNSKELDAPSPLRGDRKAVPDYLIHSDSIYKRFEPVEPPGLYFNSGDETTRQESLETLVLKTNIELNQLSYGQACIRLVAPPKANLQLVETHGVLDMLLKRDNGRNEVYKKADYLPADPEIYQIGTTIPFLTDPCCQGFSVRIENFSTDNKSIKFLDWETSGKEFLERVFVALKVTGKNVKEEKIEYGEDGINIRIKPGSIYDVSLESAFHANPKSFEPTDYDANDTSLPIDIFHPILQEGEKKITVPKKLKFLHAVQKPVVRRKGKQEVYYRPSYGLRVEIADRTPNASVPIKFSKLLFETIPDINARCFPISTSCEFTLLATSSNIIMDDTQQNGYRKEVRTVQKTFSNLGEDGKLKLEDDFNAEIFLTQFEGFEHSFGDTQFRKVQYSLSAMSRFREYFPEKDPKDLQVEGNVPGEVIILNSNLPEAPVIHSIVPIFNWSKSETTVSREQNVVRIYFEGDWYSSGPDEKVAILFLENKNSIEESYENLVSEFGKDPATPGPATTGLKKAFFQSENIVGRGEMDKIDYRLLGKRITQDISNNPILIVPASSDESLYGAVYEVNFDQESRRFYSDIVLILNKETALYSPFLKLAVSRYQEHSIREKDQYDYRFSPVAMAPTVQLLPFRKLSWKNSFNLSTLALEQNPSKPGNEIYIFLEKEISSKTPENGTPNGKMKILHWDKRNNVSLKEYDLVTIEEYEHYEAGPPEFTILNGKDHAYNPRNDIRKRLIFSYQHKL